MNTNTHMLIKVFWVFFIFIFKLLPLEDIIKIGRAFIEFIK